jgi:5-methylthioadenosine/S-adenosylhomocysteine deaminase
MTSENRMQADILICNAYVVTVDDARRVFTNGYLAIKNGLISAVGPMTECHVDAAQVIDATARLLMPGFANAHNHLIQVAFRGYNDDRWPVLDIPTAVSALLRQLFLIAGRLDEERAYALTRLHLLEMLKAGYVSTHDEHFTNVGHRALDGSWAAVRESGMRGFLARCILNTEMIPREGCEDVDAGLAEVARLRACFASPMIEVVPGILNFSFLDDPEDMRRIGQGARHMGARLDIDMTDNSRGAKLRARGFEGGQVQYYQRFGLLEEPLYAGKAVHLRPEDCAVLARADARLGLVPVLRFFDTAGLPIHHLLANGILAGLGTDAPLVSDSQNPFEMMRMAILAQNLAVKREVAAGGQVPARDLWLTAERAIEMATLGGARTLFKDEVSGSLSVGKSADCILVRLSDASIATGWDGCRAIGALVWGGGTQLIDRVFIAGKCLIAGGCSTVWNEEEVVSDAVRVMNMISREVPFDSMLSPRKPGKTFRGWQYH